MSINSDCYYKLKKRFISLQSMKEKVKERAWLLENLAKELLNDLASEWLSKEQYEKEVGINTMTTAQEEQKQMERDILKKTRGVFKYVTSCYFKDHSSSKNELVQVGYLDLEDNIVFNDVDEEHIGNPDKLIRYLPGFMVRGYRSCEEYIPVTNSYNGTDTKEINEVISSNTIQYCPSNNFSSPRVTYSVIGYLNDDEELVYYNAIVDKK